MSSPTKPRGGGTSELTRLKVLWGTLSDDARAYWQELFGSDSKQSEVRSLLLAKLKINLRFDKQLTMFRAWEIEQRALDLEAERQEAELAREMADNPGLSLDQARDKMLIQAYARAKVTGDFDLGLRAVVQDLNVKKISLDSRRLAILEKKAEAFDQAKEVVESTLTPEEQKARLKEILK